MWLETCEAAARAGGRELTALLGRFNTREKAPADLVTDADLAHLQKLPNLLSVTVWNSRASQEVLGKLPGAQPALDPNVFYGIDQNGQLVPIGGALPSAPPPQSSGAAPLQMKTLNQ